MTDNFFVTAKDNEVKRSDFIFKGVECSSHASIGSSILRQFAVTDSSARGDQKRKRQLLPLMTHSKKMQETEYDHEAHASPVEMAKKLRREQKERQIDMFAIWGMCFFCSLVVFSVMKRKRGISQPCDIT